MRPWIASFAGILLAAALVSGCGDDDENPRVPGVFSVSLTSLPVLSDSLYYEAYVGFPESTLARGAGPRALHGDAELVSLGAFIVDEHGALHSLDGEGEAEFALAEAGDLNVAEHIVINVRALGDTTTGATLLGGDVVGTADEGRSTLTTSFPEAVGADLTTAAGTCILATPSTAGFLDEIQGVWFVEFTTDDPPLVIPSLTLPELGESWVYGAWIAQSDGTEHVGNFTRADSLDSDGTGPGAGPDPGFSAPGSDFLNPPPGRILNDGETGVFITIEPAGHEGTPEPQLGDEPPFPLRVLELGIPLGALPGTSMALFRPVTPLPTGSITFTR